ncbi:hypothetical protein HK11_03655 [Acetobacter sp. DmW_043]|nr:hypothetical protein HK11_03655 [Acetobacter sp. DmW_043]
MPAELFLSDNNNQETTVYYCAAAPEETTDEMARANKNTASKRLCDHKNHKALSIRTRFRPDENIIDLTIITGH